MPPNRLQSSKPLKSKQIMAQNHPSFEVPQGLKFNRFTVKRFKETT